MRRGPRLSSAGYEGPHRLGRPKCRHPGPAHGWWLEGHIENFTGWSIGSPVIHGTERRDCAEDADCLYAKLEKVIVPMYYRNREGFLQAMYGAIAVNGAFFNTQRMIQQYVVKAYL